MKFEIRRVQNGAVLRVEPDHPNAEPAEVVYQEGMSGIGKSVLAAALPFPRTWRETWQ